MVRSSEADSTQAIAVTARFGQPDFSRSAVGPGYRSFAPTVPGWRQLAHASGTSGQVLWASSYGQRSVTVALWLVRALEGHADVRRLVLC